MSKIRFKSAMPFIGLTIFIITIVFLGREIKQYSINDIIKHITAISPVVIILAVVFMILNHLALTFYDYLAFKNIGKSLQYRKVALTSLISFIFGNNIGFSGFSSSAVRFRLYSSWKVAPSDVLQVIMFCLISFWIGLISTAGVVFIIMPQTKINLSIFSIVPTFVLGIIFIGLTILYLSFVYFWRKPIVISENQFIVPGVRISLLQIIVSIADWALAGAVLYVLLPNFSQIPFLEFLAIFMLALIAGFVSNIPGGIGVFETVIIASLSKVYSADIILSSIFVYRLIYYMFPLIAATVAYSIFEILHVKELLKGIVKFIAEMTSNMIPSLISICLFIGGLVLFFDESINSAVRLEYFNQIIPKYIIELSHFLSSIIGLILVVTSFGIKKRVGIAYDTAIIALMSGVVFSFLKGIRSEEALIFVVILITMLLSKNMFYNKLNAINKYGIFFFLVFILFGIISTVWISVFSHSQADYIKIFSWQFNVESNTPFVLKAVLLLAVLVLVFALLKIFKPFKYHLKKPSIEEIESIKKILNENNNAYANLALLGDKQFFINKDNDTFIMYGVIGKSWVVYGDPVGNKIKSKEILLEFYEFCMKNDGVPVFYQISGEDIALYLDIGMSIVKIGEEAKVNLESFSLDGKSKSKMRYTKNRLEKNGFVFEIVDKGKSRVIMSQLRLISDKWLERKNVREKRFSLGYFDENYLENFNIAVIKKEEKIVAYANIFLTNTKEELCVDMMRYIPGEIDHCMEYLFINLMLWGKENGYKRYNLGMAPLAGFHNSKFASLWNKMGYMLFHHGEKVYNFKGLKSFKEQFEPAWDSKYIALPGGVGVPKTIFNIGVLISGGISGIIKK